MKNLKMIGVKQLLFVCIIVQIRGHETVDSRVQSRVQELLDSIITKEYNINLRPYGVNGTEATLVTVQLRDVNVLSVEENGRVTFQTYYRQEWVDPRLAYNDSSVPYIPIRDCKSIWTPDLYFNKGIDSLSNFHSGRNTRLALIYPDGRVYSSYRLTQTIICPSVYSSSEKEFVCGTGLQSYGYYTEDLLVSLREQGLNSIDSVVLPKYNFVGVSDRKCDNTRTYRHHDDGHAHGCVGFDFRFSRA